MTPACTVYATGRSIADANLPDSVVRIPCDHTDDEQVAACSSESRPMARRLDVLVNGVWGGYDQMMENGQFTWPKPFWEQPLWRWDAMMDAGVRAGYVASHHAARLMVPHRQRADRSPVALGGAEASEQRGLRRVESGHRQDGRPHGARTPAARCHRRVALSWSGADRERDAVCRLHGSSNSESPEFTGRVVAALAADPDVAASTANGSSSPRLLPTMASPISTGNTRDR